MKRSLWLGASLAPLTAPILYVVFVMFFVPDTTARPERTWEAALVALTFGLIPASYLVTFVFGAPLIYILGRFEKLSFLWVVLLAAPLGAIALVSLLLVALGFGADVRWEEVEWDEVALFLSTGATLGVVVATEFCLLTGLVSSRSSRRRH